MTPPTQPTSSSKPPSGPVCPGCGRRLRSITQSKCPDCARPISISDFDGASPRTRRLLVIVPRVFLACFLVSLVLLAVYFAWFSPRHAFSFNSFTVYLLAVPLGALATWSIGEQGWAADNSTARAIYGTIGAVLVILSQLLAAYLIFR